MIEICYFCINCFVFDEDFDFIDYYIWVVEFICDGEFYLWRLNEEGIGFVKMFWIMKKVVEDFFLFSDLDEGIMYIGDKKIIMVIFNVVIGVIMEEVGFGGVFVNQVDNESCYKLNVFIDEDEVCYSGIIILGCIEYIVVIYCVGSGFIVFFKYSEWGFNICDRDLIQQNQFSRD